MEDFDPSFHISRNGRPTAQAMRAKIRAWVTSPWLIDLVKLYGGQIETNSPLDLLLADLEKFSDHWDFRRIARAQGAPADDNHREGQGAARWLTTDSNTAQENEPRILDDARYLGLVQVQAPLQLSYDYILVLGGARLSCLLRPQRAAELVRTGIRANHIGLLGAARPVAETERDATDTFAPGATDEFELIVAGAAKSFGFDSSAFDEERFDHPSNINLSWVIRRFRTVFAGQSLNVFATSAPSSEPLVRRANSTDTLVFFLEHEKVPPRSRLLLITSQIYVPYVQLGAATTIALPRDLIVETVGFPNDWQPQLQGLRNPSNYLQEIRSTIQAARRFCIAFPEESNG